MTHLKRALFVCLVVVGCKSGEGERCQVNDDCASPLVCNPAKNTCQQAGVTGQIDAAPVIDAPPADAPTDGMGSGSGSGSGSAI